MDSVETRSYGARRDTRSGDPLITVERVTKSFRKRPILQAISLGVSPGEVVALIGENGSGKSTLLKLCAGLIKPDSGSLMRHGRVGYCPQIPGLMDLLTAQEHLALFDRAPLFRAIDGAGSGLRILSQLRFPPGDIGSTVVKELSGGTAQKLNLALAMLGDADVLLLDEPYQGFDQGSYVNFWDFAAEWRAAGKAVVVVTHLLAELNRVDRVLELCRTDQGGVLEQIG